MLCHIPNSLSIPYSPTLPLIIILISKASKMSYFKEAYNYSWWHFVMKIPFTNCNTWKNHVRTFCQSSMRYDQLIYHLLMSSQNHQCVSINDLFLAFCLLHLGKPFLVWAMPLKAILHTHASKFSQTQ